eukprot:CFRG5711T1
MDKRELQKVVENVARKTNVELDDVLLEYMVEVIGDYEKHGTICSPADLCDVIEDLLPIDESQIFCSLLYDSLTPKFWRKVKNRETKSVAKKNEDNDTGTQFECLPEPFEMAWEKSKAAHSGDAYAVQKFEAADSDSEDDARDGEESGEESPIGGCQICERPMPLTKHHLIPKKLHKLYKKKKGQSVETLQLCINVCRPCHSAIHRIYDEKTLASSYNSLELLMSSEEIIKFARYASKQKLKCTEDIRLNRSKRRYHLNVK